MQGTAFFRPANGKCPNCGSFGEEQDEFHRCPACQTRFNEYIVLEDGVDIDRQNN